MPAKNQPASRQASHLNRRHFLLTASALAAGVTVAGLPIARHAAAEPRLRDDLFTLGVASGDPAPDGFVLWTRLARDPLAEDGLGGMPNRRVLVEYQIAEDAAFTRVIRRGHAHAAADWAYSVHAEIGGLRPDRDYWYRFRASGQLSPVGRARTAPARDANLAALTFGFASCSNLPSGYFTAYRQMAEENFDLIVHLGDYLYEGAGTSTLPNRSHLPAHEMFSLADYRLRHSQYKTDPDLQAAHASAPWVSIWDDHEVENNYADEISQPDTEPDQDPQVFSVRRAAAYRAYYENMPMRRTSLPSGPDMQIYRTIHYGQLAEFNMIDTRQYRDDQLEVCVDDCAERWDPSRTYLGKAQEDWLFGELSATESTWNILGNQQITFNQDKQKGPGKEFGLDGWNGYAAARQRMYDAVHGSEVENFVVITGDAHRNTAADLKLDFNDESSPTIGAEFLGTSITSGGDGNPKTVPADLENPHIKFVNRQRGYQRISLTPELLQCEYKVLEKVTVPDAPVSVRATCTVEAGKAGLAGLDH